jgi:hypothetical protein
MRTRPWPPGAGQVLRPHRSYQPLVIEHVFGHSVGMLGDTDLTDPHAVNRLRRSVAMLRPGARVFNREDALRLLQALKDATPR